MLVKTAVAHLWLPLGLRRITLVRQSNDDPYTPDTFMSVRYSGGGLAKDGQQIVRGQVTCIEWRQMRGVLPSVASYRGASKIGEDSQQ